MIYFYTSSRKSDRLVRPVTICASSEKRAFGLALISFKKHKLVGTPVKVNIK